MNLRQATLTRALAGILTTLAYFASLLAHELAHSLVARHYGLTVNSITLWLLGGVSGLGGKPPRKELHEAAEQLTASEAVCSMVGSPTIEKALDNAITGADKVVKRFVDAATGEIAEELKEALKS